MEYRGPTTKVGNIKVEVRCYTRADARLRYRLWQLVYMALGAFIGILIIQLLRTGLGLTHRFLRWLFRLLYGEQIPETSRWVLEQIIRILTFPWVWPLVFLAALLLGLLIGYLLWKRFIAQNHCNCPAGVIGFCLLFTYRIIFLGIPILVSVRTDSQHCQIIPPGCP